jgi:rhodanese-related sulfurtransferase
MMWPDEEQSEEVSPQFLQNQLQAKEPFLLIDCRELDEWHFNRIEGARHLPMSQFSTVAQSLFATSDQTMVVYCHHGVRSLNVTRWLRHHGCSRVFSLSGGIHQWSMEIDPSVPVY